MTRPTGRRRRNGSMLPLLAVSIISLFAFVALAVDLGMLAVSRTQCQNAADAAALTGCPAIPGVCRGMPYNRSSIVLFGLTA